MAWSGRHWPHESPLRNCTSLAGRYRSIDGYTQIAYSNPDAGKIISGTGSVRKLRWALPGNGKGGCARVSHYYHSARIPVFLLAAYAKNEKENLTAAEREAMKRLVPMRVMGYPRST